MTALIGKFIMRLFGALVTLSIFFITLFVENIPAIIYLIEIILVGFFRLSYQAYHYVLINVPATAGFDGPSGIWLVIATSLISVGIYWLITLLIGTTVNVFLSGLALAHGLYVGLAWETLADPDGLDVGRRIQ